MTELFVPSDGIGALPQLFLIICYGYILFIASKIMSDGSEMLLAIYGPGQLPAIDGLFFFGFFFFLQSYFEPYHSLTTYDHNENPTM